MQDLINFMGSATIRRVRTSLGAILLVAAVVTWGIGLMMSPHGQPVVAGTEHIRSTVVTFRHNAAIGTLILSAIAAWLLYPKLRSKWPMRDWALIVLFMALTASSIYTLLWLTPSVVHGGAPDENVAISDANMDAISSGGAQASELPPTSMTAVSPYAQFPSPDPVTGAAERANNRVAGTEQEQSSEVNLTRDQQDATKNAQSESPEDEIANDGTDENQD